jgi:hypothetical protein
VDQTKSDSDAPDLQIKKVAGWFEIQISPTPAEAHGYDHFISAALATTQAEIVRWSETRRQEIYARTTFRSDLRRTLSRSIRMKVWSLRSKLFWEMNHQFQIKFSNAWIPGR